MQYFWGVKEITIADRLCDNIWSFFGDVTVELS